MGTYTTNYNLFMPSVGEQGWGELVNGNFTTIDVIMAGLNTRVGTLETETTTLDGRVTALEPLSIIQVDSNKNVTFPGNVNSVGNIIASVPIRAKLSTIDEGIGWITYSTSSAKTADFVARNSLTGFTITNPTDTYTVTVTPRGGANGTTVVYSAVNLLTGERRELGSIGAANNQTPSKTFTLYVTEYILITGGNVSYLNGHSASGPRIYLNSP